MSEKISSKNCSLGELRTDTWNSIYLEGYGGE